MPTPRAKTIMGITDKFKAWLENHGQIDYFLQLQRLQDIYMRETAPNWDRGYRGISDEKLKELNQKYDARQANIREELRRRGVV